MDPDVPAQPQTTNPTRNNIEASLFLPILCSPISFFQKKDYLELDDASEGGQRTTFSLFYLRDFCPLQPKASHQPLLIKEECIDLRL